MGWIVLPAAVALFLAAPPMIVVAAVLDLKRRAAPGTRRQGWTRRFAFGGLAALAASLGLFFFGRQVELVLDLPWLLAIQRRAAPVVEALDRYRRERGGVPATLSELVPTYFAEVPTTGWGAHPRFELGWHEGGFGLYVACGRGLSFDQYVHAPSPFDSERGGSTTRIGDWVYCHE